MLYWLGLKNVLSARTRSEAQRFARPAATTTIHPALPNSFAQRRSTSLSFPLAAVNNPSSYRMFVDTSVRELRGPLKPRHGSSAQPIESTAIARLALRSSAPRPLRLIHTSVRRATRVLAGNAKRPPIPLVLAIPSKTRRFWTSLSGRAGNDAQAAATSWSSRLGVTI